jgi:hypothetical protein
LPKENAPLGDGYVVTFALARLAIQLLTVRHKPEFLSSRVTLEVTGRFVSSRCKFKSEIDSVTRLTSGRVIARPYSTDGGKKTEARVQRVDKPGVTETRAGSYENINAAANTR